MKIYLIIEWIIFAWYNNNYYKKYKQKKGQINLNKLSKKKRERDRVGSDVAGRRNWTLHVLLLFCRGAFDPLAGEFTAGIAAGVFGAFVRSDANGHDRRHPLLSLFIPLLFLFFLIFLSCNTLPPSLKQLHY